MTKNKLIGTIIILSAMTLLFFSPVIYRWYIQYFKFTENDEGAKLTIYIFLLLTIVGLSILSAFFFSKNSSK